MGAQERKPDENTPHEQPYLDGLMAKMDEANEDTVIRWWDVLNVIFAEIDSCDKALLYMAPGTNEKEIIELQKAIICGFFRKIVQLPHTQPEEVTPHKNYKYLNSFWCECGCNLGKKWKVKYCPDCGKKVKWDG